MGVLFGLIEAAARSPVPEKTLVFSQFTETLDVIEALLQSRQVRRGGSARRAIPQLPVAVNHERTRVEEGSLTT